jgi:exodeoxyribonuclease VII small subunit
MSRTTEGGHDVAERTSQAVEPELTFEAALGRLEDIVEKLEAGEQTLDEAIALYEEGVRLYRLCGEKLAAARGRLEKVVESETGEIALEPLEDGDPEKDV